MDQPTIDTPVAVAGLLIRKPIGEVDEAFIDPSVTSRFWYSRGSERLDAGKPVQWMWDQYGITVDVENRGFAGDDDAVIAQALDSVGGFALLMAGAKAWLEHGFELGLVRDRYPAGT